MTSKKTKALIIFSTLIFLGSVLGVFLLWQYLQSEGSQLVSQAKEIADFNALEQTYRDLENLVNQTQADRDELNAYVLTENETVDFLAAIEQVAVEQAVELTTNSLQVTEGKDFFDTLTISYSVDGPKNNVDALLLLLETLPYHTFISNISLNYTPTNGGSTVKGSIALTVSLLNYDR